MELLMFVNCFVLGVVLGIFSLIKYRYSYWSRQGVPHVSASVPYGSYKIIGKTLNISKALEDAYSYLSDRGLFGGIYICFKPIAIATNLDLIKNILGRDFGSFSERGLYYNGETEPLTANLMTLEEEKWKDLRKKLEPTFSPESMKYIFPSVLKVAKEFQRIFFKQSRVQHNIEICDLFSRFTLSAIGKTVFGKDYEILTDNNSSEFATQLQKMLTEKRHGPCLQAFMNKCPKLSEYLRIEQLPDKTHDYFYKEFRHTLTYREQNGMHCNDYFDLLMRMIPTNELTPLQCAAQAFTFLVSGYEATSIALSYCLYELAMHQDVQDRLRQEIKEILAKNGGELTYEALSNMKYMEQVVNETLRLHPPIPSLTRKALKDYHMEKNTRKIQKGNSVMIPICAIQKDELIHRNDPQEFDPERFSPENFKKLPPCSFMPFGNGPRNCIGMPFAKMLISVGLVTLLQNLKFLTGKDTEIPVVLDATSPLESPQNGIVLKVESI